MRRAQLPQDSPTSTTCNCRQVKEHETKLLLNSRSNPLRTVRLQELDAYLLKCERGVLLQFTNYLLFVTAKAGAFAAVVVSSCLCSGYGTPGVIRTPDPLLRRRGRAICDGLLWLALSRYSCGSARNGPL